MWKLKILFNQNLIRRFGVNIKFKDLREPLKQNKKVIFHEFRQSLKPYFGKSDSNLERTI